MAPLARLINTLAFAAAVVAVPQDHGHAHAKLHRRSAAVSASGSNHRSSAPSSYSKARSSFTKSALTSFATVISTAATVDPAAWSWGSDAGSWTSSCTTDVTVTNTEQTTVYVTAGAGTSSPETSSVKVSTTEHVTSSTTSHSTTSSTEAAPVASSASATYSAPVYSAASSLATSSEAIPTSTAAATYQTTSIEWSSSTSSALPTLASTLSEADKGAGASASSTVSSATAPSASSYSSSSSGNSGKRGLAYNTASLTNCFSGSSQISWAYNWASSSSGFAMSGVNYIPTLWGTASDFTSSWATNAQAALSAGSTHLFSFNEPDLSAQSNLSPAAAAAGYLLHMMPFASKAKLCAPSVTNGGGAMGLTWLENFLAACPTCQIDCVNIHWYDSATNIDYFKEHVTNATQIAKGKPVFVSEFGATGTDAQINSFLEEVMPWMDSQAGVAGYAYYMVASGLLVDGTEPSSYGSTYKSYTG